MSHSRARLLAIALCSLMSVALVSCNDDEKPSTTEDLTTTVAISSTYESTSTEVSLTVSFSLGGTPSEAGIVYSYTEAEPTLSNATKVQGTVDGDSFTLKMAALNPSRTYFYRAYFINDNVCSYSAICSFKTANDPSAIVTTIQPERLMSFIATLGGQTTVAANVKSAGIEFSTSQRMTPAQTLSATLQGETFSSTITGLSPDSLYYYRAFVTMKDGNKKYGEILTLKPRKQTETIDLGLKTLWCSRNLGAEQIVNYGKYTAWGFLGNPQEEDATYNNCPEGYAAGTEPPSSISATKYDIAQATLGEGFRLPTQADLLALRDSCDWTLVTMRSGHYGYVVTSRKNDNSIFLPFGGKADYVNGKWTYSSRNTECNYWTGTLDTSTTESGWKYAYTLHATLKGRDINHATRPSYINIRPVANKK